MVAASGEGVCQGAACVAVQSWFSVRREGGHFVLLVSCVRCTCCTYAHEVRELSALWLSCAHKGR